MERSAVTGALLLEELGVGDLSMALAMLAPATFAYPMLDYGTDAQKDKWLPPCTAATFPKLTAALVEPNMDFDATALECRARKEGGGYVLNGRSASCRTAAAPRRSSSTRARARRGLRARAGVHRAARQRRA